MVYKLFFFKTQSSLTLDKVLTFENNVFAITENMTVLPKLNPRYIEDCKTVYLSCRIF